MPLVTGRTVNGVKLQNWLMKRICTASRFYEGLLSLQHRSLRKIAHQLYGST